MIDLLRRLGLAIARTSSHFDVFPANFLGREVALDIARRFGSLHRNHLVALGAFPDSNAQAGREHAVPRYHGGGFRKEGIGGQDLIDGSMRDTGQRPKFVGPFSIGL